MCRKDKPVSIWIEYGCARHRSGAWVNRRPIWTGIGQMCFLLQLTKKKKTLPHALITSIVGGPATQSRVNQRYQHGHRRHNEKCYGVTWFFNFSSILVSSMEVRSDVWPEIAGWTIGHWSLDNSRTMVTSSWSGHFLQPACPGYFSQ